MATNDELVARARELAEKAGGDFDPAGKSNRELADEVKALKAKADAADQDDKNPPEPEPDADAEAKAKAEAEEAARLEAEQKAKEQKAKEQAEAEAKAKAEAEAQAKANKPKGDRVAKGKSITTKAGIKSEGTVIKASDLGGGAEALKELKKKGFIE